MYRWLLIWKVASTACEEHGLGVAAALADGPQVADRLVVLLLVVDERRAVRPGPVAFVTFVRVLACVSSHVVDQIV